MVTWSELESSWSGLGSTWSTVDNPSAVIISPTLELQNYQYRYRGLVWGANTAFGVELEEGLDGLDIASGSRGFSRRHGNLPGLNFANEKIIRFRLGLDNQVTFEDIEESLRQFRNIITAHEELDRNRDWLEFKRPGKVRQRIRCRPLIADILREASNPAMIKFPLVFEAEDPRVYMCETKSVILLPYDTSVVGADFPMNFPVDFEGDAGTGSIEVVVTNMGNSVAYPRMQVFGPDTGVTTSVSFMNVTTGQTSTVTTDIVANQVLTMDMEAMLYPLDTIPITLDGSTRYGDWQHPREPFVLAPGDNLLRLIVEGQTTGVISSIQWNCTSI